MKNNDRKMKNPFEVAYYLSFLFCIYMLFACMVTIPLEHSICTHSTVCLCVWVWVCKWINENYKCWKRWCVYTWSEKNVEMWCWCVCVWLRFFRIFLFLILDFSVWLSSILRHTHDEQYFNVCSFRSVPFCSVFEHQPTFRKQQQQQR